MKTEHADLSILSINREKQEYDSEKDSRKRIRLILYTLVVLAVAVALFETVRRVAFTKPFVVQTVAATFRSPTEAQSLLSASGYVVAQRKAAVASKATGLLEQLHVKEGDQVKANMILARLQDNDIKAQVAEAEAQLSLSLAESTEASNALARQRELTNTKQSSKADLERAETNYMKVLATIQIAKARLAGAQVALENTIIRAPFDGTVLTKNADVGEIVAPMAAGASARAAVVTIADLGSLQLEADVSESNIEKIHRNAKCEIRLDAYPTRSYPGYVASIIPTADRSKGAVMVKIGFREYDERVLPEMSAKVTFLKESEIDSTKLEPPVLVVPQTAVVKRNGKDVVFRVVEKKAVETPVQIGSSFHGFIEIRNGIASGERVILNVDEKVVDGVSIVIG